MVDYVLNYISDGHWIRSLFPVFLMVIKIHLDFCSVYTSHVGQLKLHGL